MSLVGNYDLKGTLIDILHKTHIKFAHAAHAVCVLHPLGNRIIAAQVDSPTANAPQEHLHIALGIAVVCLCELRAAQLRLKHGNKPVFALDCDFEGACRLFQIRFRPHAERNEIFVERGQILNGIFNA